MLDRFLFYFRWGYAECKRRETRSHSGYCLKNYEVSRFSCRLPYASISLLCYFILSNELRLDPENACHSMVFTGTLWCKWIRISFRIRRYLCVEVCRVCSSLSLTMRRLTTRSQKRQALKPDSSPDPSFPYSAHWLSKRSNVSRMVHLWLAALLRKVIYTYTAPHHDAI